MDAQVTSATYRPERLAYPIDESCEMLGGISQAKFFDMKKNGEIKTIKIGNRTFVPRTELERLTRVDSNVAA